MTFEREDYMRKTIVSSLFFLTLINGLFAAENFSVSLTANCFRPSDSGYREIYNSAEFLPEIKVGAIVYKNFYLWASVGYLQSTGETIPELSEETKSAQTFSSLGAGIKHELNAKLSIRLGAGLLAVRYKEEAFSGKVSGSEFGFIFDGGLQYSLVPGFFVDLSTGYLSASDKIEGVSIKLGGLKAGVGIGIEF